MLTLAPLPKLGALLRAFIYPKPDMDKLAHHWVKQGEVAGWFSRSAWSLVRIAMWRITLSEKKSCSVWVPDYFCNTSLSLLRAIGVELIFYPVTTEMLPDFKACRQLAKEQQMDLFIIVHYFGEPVQAAIAKELCSQNNAWLIEDAAHVLRRTTDIGKYGDFILFSPHKLIAIPDGALLVVCPKGPAKLGKGLLTQFGEAKYWFKELSCLDERQAIFIRSSLLYIFTWMMKRVLQKMGLRGKELPTSYLEPPKRYMMTSPISMISPKMNLFSLKLLAAQVDEIPTFARLRQRNLLHWKGILDKLNIPYQNINDPQKGGWTPYLAAFKLDYSQAEEQFKRLRAQSLPIMTWPDLPLEVLEERNSHEVAYLLRHSHLFFPIHQTIRDRDLSYMGRELVQADKKLQVKVSWDCSTRTEWAAYLKKSERSNLLQSWEYGEAKQSIESWHVKRGVFSIDGQEVAIVQVLEKRLLGFLKVYRINRGPLFLKEPDQATVYAVFSVLKNEFAGLLKRQLLFHAPGLTLNGSSLMLMSGLRYTLKNPKGWESVWIDLMLSVEKLRKQLNPKWRQMLVTAEKNHFLLDVCTDLDSFDWILKQCSEMMSSRNAGKIPVELYRDLQKRLDETSQPLTVFKAFSGEELVAGIGIIRHGSAATYLLGWNGETGRKLKANQFLLWHAMLYLKEQGVKWFDLGGVDKEGVPGITEFKLGVNGEKYSLVGEYMSINVRKYGASKLAGK
jgi:dTDP-4-amino-4,6-dideoxygalactose transaminase